MAKSVMFISIYVQMEISDFYEIAHGSSRSAGCEMKSLDLLEAFRFGLFNRVQDQTSVTYVFTFAYSCQEVPVQFL